jgi:hypothetical protein
MGGAIVLAVLVVVAFYLRARRKRRKLGATPAKPVNTRVITPELTEGGFRRTDKSERRYMGGNP